MNAYSPTKAFIYEVCDLVQSLHHWPDDFSRVMQVLHFCEVACDKYTLSDTSITLEDIYKTVTIGLGEEEQ